MSEELWFAEGFTSYYGPLAIKRAGITSLEDYARAIGFNVATVLTAPGRNYFSAAEMSMQAPFVDAAASIDPQNRSNTFISYYTYGAAIGLGLDLLLRTEKGSSLDDFMRAMWARHGRTERAYTLNDWRITLGQVVRDGGEAAHQLGTGPVAIGVQDARARVRRLEAEPEPAVVTAIELGAELQELTNAFGALGDQHPHGLGIREPVARFERVLRMQGRRVSGTDGHGDAALRPRRGAVRKLALREQYGAAALAGQAPCGPQSRYTGANDDRRGV
jgi:hypothetical protein